MRSRQSAAMEPLAGAGWPSSASAVAIPGAAKATTPYREDLETRERQQEPDPRGGAERARSPRLDLGIQSVFPDRQPAEQQGRRRQAAAAAAAECTASWARLAEAVAERSGSAVFHSASEDPDPVPGRLDQSQRSADRRSGAAQSASDNR